MNNTKKLSEKEKLNEVKSNSAQVIIGKSGLSENIIAVISKQLKKDKIVKIKILKTAPDLKELGRKEYAREIADRLNAKLIEIRGFNIVIKKKE